MWFSICIYYEMITIIKLINTSITLHSYLVCGCVCVCGENAIHDGSGANRP